MKNIQLILRFSIFIMLLIIPQFSNAQNSLTIKGQVNGTDGQPIPGVSIVVKNTSNGQVADFDGNYIIKNIKKGDILIFSSIGYQTSEKIVGEATIINVILKESRTDLDEIVVIGYGTARKKDLTGAVSTIQAKAIEEQPVANVDQLLQGQVSGITVTRASGQPGGAVSVRVRGVTSITGSNEPLYVIDGVQVNSAGSSSFNFSQFGGAGGQTQVSPLSTLNPSDIESIQILKDASAAAIYGSQAANGVVLITTKRGKAGVAKITLESYSGMQSVPRTYDLMNLREYAQYTNEARATIGLEPLPQFKNPAILGDGTDWQDAIFRQAPIKSHQLSITGGNESTKYYTSVNYFEQEGIVINTDFRRFSMRLNLDHKFSDKFKMGNNINFSNSLENVVLNDAANGIIATALQQSPDIPVRLSDGTFGAPNQTLGLGTDEAVNPVAWADIRKTNLERFKINGNIFVEAKLLEGLTFRTDMGYDFNTSRSEAFNPTYEFGGIINEVNTSVKSLGESFFWLFKNYFTYDQDFGKNSFNFLLGMEAQEGIYKGLTGQRANFPNNDLTGLNTGDVETSVASSVENGNSLVSYFGRVNYNYDSKYYLSASLRYDGSSKFADGNRFDYFPSVSGAWVVSKESFLKDNDVISWLKIRAGYGTSGNQGVGNNLFLESLTNVPTAFGSGFVIQNFANPNIGWETLISPNLGIELGLLDDKIHLEVDLYQKVSKDFLAPEPLPSIFGTHNSQAFLGVSPPTINFGEMVNTGIDLSLKTRNIANDKLEWTTNLVFSAYKNEIRALVNEGDAISGFFAFGQELTRSIVGQPIGQFYGFVTDGLFRSQEELSNGPIPIETRDSSQPEVNGTWLGDIRFKDLKDDGIITDEDRTFIGSPHPDFTYSITNNFKMGMFDFSIFLQGSQGNEVYNWTRSITEGMTLPSNNQVAAVANRYSAANPNGILPRYINGNPNGNNRISDRFIEDASYLRIQNVSLGCTLPSTFFGKKSFINQLRIYSTVQNLYTFTNYSGFDPEVGSYNQSATLTGVDFARYPVPRTITLGLNVQF
ncbi:TonB-dependent receptor [uncultured Polaribacter sp.]|uniref:SusC/RagA family TonB-linked outer membrane protein n=1 Tax=uncultured Polaribacter sp. TaxID=174711 RepID=UPI00261A67D4|nr:TonB-dependent receptor [uncultured Polaribacter sp.]